MARRQDARRGTVPGGPNDETPKVDGPYRIAAVAQLTGVPEPTLRAWERRYGIPAPERGTSGYRLYSLAEVQQVLEMRRLCDEGVAAAEAARLVSARKAGLAAGMMREATAEDAHETLVRAMLDAIHRYDDAALETHLRRLFFLGSAANILDRVLAPVLHDVGNLWHAGGLTVAQEHFATHKLRGVLWDLLRLTTDAQAPDCVVLASFADDEHDLGLLGVALHISEWGMRPIVLGARTPASAVRSAVEAWSPELVALSVTVTPEGPRARKLLDDYGAACGRVPWIVGGAGAPGMRDLIEKSGGVFTGLEPSALGPFIRKLLASKKTAPGRGTRP